MMHTLLNLMVAMGIAGLVISTLALMSSIFVSHRHAFRYAILSSALWGLLIAPLLAIGYGYWNVSWLRLSLISANGQNLVDSNAANILRGEASSTSDTSKDSNEIADAIEPSNDSDESVFAKTMPVSGAIKTPDSTSGGTINQFNVIDRNDKSTAVGQEIVSQLSFMWWFKLASILWIVGVAICLLRIVTSLIGVFRLRRTCTTIANGRIEAARNLVMKTFRALAAVPIVESSVVQSPLVLGIRQPLIVLPKGLAERFDSIEIADVLTHETAHIQRRDNLVILLQHIVASVYWPLPTVHWLNQQLEQAREELCDNFVLQSRDAVDYGQTLGRLAEQILSTQSPSLSSGIFFHRASKLQSRIQSLLQQNRDTSTHARRYAGPLLLSLFIASSIWLASCSLFALQSDDNKTVASHPSSSIPPNERDISTPEFAGNYFGQVFDVAGKPLAGAEIYVMRNDSQTDDQTSTSIGPVRTLSDENGGFDFYAPEMTYQHYDGLKARREGLLVAVKEGYGADWITTWGHNSEQGSHWNPDRDEKLEFHLAKSDIVFHGKLLAPDGSPLAGANVRISQVMTPPDRNLDQFLEQWKNTGGLGGFLSSGPSFENTLWTPEYLPDTSIEASTNVQGEFEFKGLPRDRLVYLDITAPNIVDTTITAMVRETEPITPKDNDDSSIPNFRSAIFGSGFVLKMETGLTIKGRVVDKDSKQPVSGMWLGPLSNIVNEFSSSLYPWRTDADGRFTITGLSPTILDPSPNSEGDKPPSYQMIVAATTPGLSYETAWGYIKPTTNRSLVDDLVIEVRRGIPFHLKLVDDEGQPVDAQVTYVDVVADNAAADEVIYPVGRAAKNSDGTYTGFVKTGPGAILIKTHWRDHFRPAKVDPKSFFAPGKSDWTAEQIQGSYGTDETLVTHQGRYLDVYWRTNIIQQRNYSAILLVNPAADSAPLELTATLQRYRPRKIYLYDPDGNPLSGVYSTMNRPTQTDLIRGKSFEVTDLTTDRDLEVTFSKRSGDETSELVALAIIRENGPVQTGQLVTNIPAPDNDPRSIRIQLSKAARFSGRLVDEQGQPIEGGVVYCRLANGKSYNSGTADRDGRFSTGTIYSGHAYRIETDSSQFEIINRFDEFVLAPGEVRDVGDVIARKVPSSN